MEIKKETPPTEYVAGFMFSYDQSKVALVEKKRPSWQAGRLNGIGGHIEAGETPAQAMFREFKEETGYEQFYWRKFCVLEGPGFKVHFFKSLGPLHLLNTTTDEAIITVPVTDICFDKIENVIPNLTWLVPMAQSMRYERATDFSITEWHY